MFRFVLFKLNERKKRGAEEGEQEEEQEEEQGEGAGEGEEMVPVTYREELLI